jgi:outer membrane lipoprotein SlyB
MHMRALTSFVLGITSAVTLSAQSDTVRAGTDITIRTSESIDARSPSDSRIYRGVVERDVRSNDGRVMIPSGSNAELILRNSTRNEVVLDLESVDVRGQRYVISTEDERVQTSGSEKQGVGANRRTGKYVGGGAVIGSIIGAIAGGGKGAAIGAAAGAGAGAVGQTVTRGGNVRVPTESLITFRLDRDLRIGGRDEGYDRNGYHYHRYSTDDSYPANDRR